MLNITYLAYGGDTFIPLSDFVSWLKFPNFFGGENWHQSAYFDTLSSSLSIIKIAPNYLGRLMMSIFLVFTRHARLFRFSWFSCTKANKTWDNPGRLIYYRTPKRDYVYSIHILCFVSFSEVSSSNKNYLANKIYIVFWGSIWLESLNPSLVCQM